MSTEPLVIRPHELTKRSHGGSGFGISFWQTFHSGCPQKLKLNMLRQVDADALNETAGATAAKRGTYVHKLLELYYTQGLDPLNPEQATIEFSGAMEIDSEWLDACRVFREYRDKFPANEWETVSAEERFRFGCPTALGIPCKVEHDHAAASAQCFATFGVPVISGQTDMTIRVREEHREKLVETRQIPLFHEGVLVVDHKVKNAQYQNRESELMHRLQFTFYQAAWDMLHPNEPCMGLLANVIYPYKKEVRFESFLVPRVDSKRFTVLNNYLARAWRNYREFGYGPNEDACQSWGRSCYWLDIGVCEQLPIDFSLEDNQPK